MQKFSKFLNLVKLLKTSKQFISNFTERLEILGNLQNTDMKKLVKIFQNFDKFLGNTLRNANKFSIIFKNL